MDRSADVAPPVIGHHEVVEHPHRDFMRTPRPYELLRGIGLYAAAAGEGIQEHRWICAEVTDDEVARQPDASDLYPGSTSDFDVHDRQQDR